MSPWLWSTQGVNCPGQHERVGVECPSTPGACNSSSGPLLQWFHLAWRGLLPTGLFCGIEVFYSLQSPVNEDGLHCIGFCNSSLAASPFGKPYMSPQLLWQQCVKETLQRQLLLHCSLSTLSISKGSFLTDSTAGNCPNRCWRALVGKPTSTVLSLQGCTALTVTRDKALLKSCHQCCGVATVTHLWSDNGTQLSGVAQVCHSLQRHAGVSELQIPTAVRLHLGPPLPV
ncbi:hypothetical protein AOLI_G00236930 [Acnodon oligacanthus]